MKLCQCFLLLGSFSIRGFKLHQATLKYEHMFPFAIYSLGAHILLLLVFLWILYTSSYWLQPLCPRRGLAWRLPGFVTRMSDSNVTQAGRCHSNLNGRLGQARTRSRILGAVSWTVTRSLGVWKMGVGMVWRMGVEMVWKMGGRNGMKNGGRTDMKNGV